MIQFCHYNTSFLQGMQTAECKKTGKTGGIAWKTARNSLIFVCERTILSAEETGTDVLASSFRAPLKFCFRRLFASEQSPTGKIFGGYLQVATLKSSCIGLFAHPLKIHPIEFSEIPFNVLLMENRMFEKKQVQVQVPEQSPSNKNKSSDGLISGSLSGKLTAVSFFSACCIVLLHANTFYAEASRASSWIMTFFSKVMTAFAVPIFFAISGFLIAKKTNSGQLDGWYLSALKKRVRTLVVPYFAWCSVYAFLYTPTVFLKNYLRGRPLLEKTSLVEPLLSLHNLAYLYGLSFSATPALRVLWYVRNLLYLCLLTPILFPVMRRQWSALLFLGLTGIVFLLLPTLFPFFSGHGFNLQGLLFFLVGIYLADHPLKPDALLYFRRALPFFWVILAVFTTCCFRSPGMSSDHLARLLNACIVLGVGSVWGLYDMIPAFGRLSRLRISSDSFFLYAFHTMVMDMVTGSQMQDFFRSRCHIPELGIYGLRLLIPLVLSLLTAEILKRFLPKVYGVLTGGR